MECRMDTDSVITIPPVVEGLELLSPSTLKPVFILQSSSQKQIPD